jgi:hypothetical protein
MKDLIRGANLAIENGNSLFVTYFAALRRVKNKLTGKESPKYDSGIRVSEREFSPYSFRLTKADNPLVNAIDITLVRNQLTKLLKKDGSVGGLWGNVDGFMSDLAKYFTNLDQKEGARRSAEIFGVEKAKFLGDFVTSKEKSGGKFVRSFRLDRVGSMSPGEFRAKFSEEAYQLSKNRWMPAEKLGDKSVINSEEGYRIISGAKHKLYGTDGKLIGIYDTQTQAERKADATQTRLQPEVRQQQRPLGNEVGQATEAGGRNRAVGGQEGQVEGGAVRQAGDVSGQRFMPAQQAFYSKLEEVVTSKLPKLASPQQVLASVDPAKGSGVKPEELKWTGFAQAVERIAKENGGKVPKEKLIEHLNNEGSVNFEEVTLGTIWNVGDSNHTERYTNLKDALSAKEEVIDFLKSETERGWSVEEQDDGFVIVDEYGDRIREQISDSGRVVWKPYTYRSEAEAKAAIKEGAKDVAESSVVFNENQVQGSAIHADYQLPGGENYREVVLTSDTANPYTSSHYTYIENYVAHMRLNDRTATDGRNGLFIEEIQSDRHQQSREKGYGADWSKVPVYKYSDLVSKGVFPSEMHIESKPGTYSLVSADGATLETSSSLEKLKSEYDRKIGSIPDAPFRKDWSLQMFKRALRDAVASDKKWIGWTTGETQTARYDLSKQVDYIDYRQVGADKYDVAVVGKNGSDLFSETGINKSRVSDVVGKEIADKMVKGEGQSGGGRMTLRGLDLKVGGEGMKGFYDEILPKEVKKYVKQWGAEVTKSNVPESEIWRVDITPQMRIQLRQLARLASCLPATWPRAVASRITARLWICLRRAIGSMGLPTTEWRIPSA